MDASQWLELVRIFSLILLIWLVLIGWVFIPALRRK